MHQLELMIENDYTLKDKILRIQINGKGCEGFKYATYFSTKEEKDWQFNFYFEQQKTTIPFIMDEFTAFYLTHATLDYLQNYSQDLEGPFRSCCEVIVCGSTCYADFKIGNLK